MQKSVESKLSRLCCRRPTKLAAPKTGGRDESWNTWQSPRLRKMLKKVPMSHVGTVVYRWNMSRNNPRIYIYRYYPNLSLSLYICICIDNTNLHTYTIYITYKYTISIGLWSLPKHDMTSSCPTFQPRPCPNGSCPKTPGGCPCVQPDGNPGPLCPWGAGEARDLWSLMIFRPPAAKRFLTWFWTRESMSQMGSTTTKYQKSHMESK